MKVVSVEQARRHRLRAHHLDRAYGIEDAAELAGACGMQNTPPGAWETALFNRAPACRREDAERLLYGEKTLVQAWSLRGAPVVFPAAESAAFLSALVPAKGEPWAYTKGIGLALDALGMEFDRLLELLVRAMPRLDDEAIASKVALDQTLADWVEPLLPANKRAAWRRPSMCSGDKQTVGGRGVILAAPVLVHGPRRVRQARRRSAHVHLVPKVDGAARRRLTSGAEVRPLLRADEARCARGLDGVLGRAGAPHVEGHCGRAGPVEFDGKEGMGRWQPASMRSHRRSRQARCCCLPATIPISINATAPPCRSTFRCSGVSGRPLRTPASSCATGRPWARGRPRRRVRACPSRWLRGLPEPNRKLRDLAGAYAAFQGLSCWA